MNEQLTLQSTQHEETKTVPLRRRKACLAGTFALFAACALVLLIPHPAYAGIIGDFLDIPNMIKTWLLQIAATLFNTYFGVINQTLDAKFISGPFNELFGTTEPYGVVKDFYQAGVIPVAHAILGLFMLMQLIKISQRIDATSTLPAVKDIVFLVVTYCILSYFIDNALDLVSAIYSIRDNLLPVCRKVTEPAGILAVGNSAAPVIDHNHIVFLDFHLLRPFCLGMVPVPSPLLLSVTIAMRHTSTLHNARLHAFSMELGSLGASSP